MAASFDLQAVEQGIAGTRFAGKLQHFALVGSTNQLALDAAAAGARAGVWIADEQTAGRGRGGHQWHSAAGDGLYVSVLVHLPIPLSEAVKISLATGLAVQAAIRERTGLTADIRWPNDIMFGDRKCGGILVESSSDREELRFAVIGVGINLNHGRFPDELSRLATSLYLENGQASAREHLLGALLLNLERELVLLVDPDATVHLNARFAAASTWVSGKRVTVEEAGGYTGWTRGLDAKGFLRVEDDEGRMRTVLSGGVRSAQE